MMSTLFKKRNKWKNKKWRKWNGNGEGWAMHARCDSMESGNSGSYMDGLIPICIDNRILHGLWVYGDGYLPKHAWPTDTAQGKHNIHSSVEISICWLPQQTEREQKASVLNKMASPNEHWQHVTANNTSIQSSVD